MVGQAGGEYDDHARAAGLHRARLRPREPPKSLIPQLERECAGIKHLDQVCVGLRVERRNGETDAVGGPGVCGRDDPLAALPAAVGAANGTVTDGARALPDGLHGGAGPALRVDARDGAAAAASASAPAPAPAVVP
eukprot:CAMPEP_0182853188 /NCGR_PEP_ID=MMETSP0034_2-20130328/568_1 /TAXON_ID=156128 /ORGANISM="Nephroselmis pyriformis, Strain CCMP717" /LENGTH=135 /DNA_ID=CAMNT_0024983947 /DNA_START=206 /DNA_END=609 /DNA_ORIENTATION=-